MFAPGSQATVELKDDTATAALANIYPSPVSQSSTAPAAEHETKVVMTEAQQKAYHDVTQYRDKKFREMQTESDVNSDDGMKFTKLITNEKWNLARAFLQAYDEALTLEDKLYLIRAAVAINVAVDGISGVETADTVWQSTGIKGVGTERSCEEAIGRPANFSYGNVFTGFIGFNDPIVRLASTLSSHFYTVNTAHNNEKLQQNLSSLKARAAAIRADFGAKRLDVFQAPLSYNSWSKLDKALFALHEALAATHRPEPAQSIKCVIL